MYADHNTKTNIQKVDTAHFESLVQPAFLDEEGVTRYKTIILCSNIWEISRKILLKKSSIMIDYHWGQISIKLRQRFSSSLLGSLLAYA
jgi:hypothetical protein